MKKVTAYQTEDGRTFDRESEAAEHELRLEVEKIVDDFFYSGCRPDDIANGIVEHTQEFDRLFAKYAKHIPEAAAEEH